MEKKVRMFQEIKYNQNVQKFRKLCRPNSRSNMVLNMEEYT